MKSVALHSFPDDINREYLHQWILGAQISETHLSLFLARSMLKKNSNSLY
jgi:hypothetical protein